MIIAIVVSLVSARLAIILFNPYFRFAFPNFPSTGILSFSSCLVIFFFSLSSSFSLVGLPTEVLTYGYYFLCYIFCSSYSDKFYRNELILDNNQNDFYIFLFAQSDQFLHCNYPNSIFQYT